MKKKDLTIIEKSVRTAEWVSIDKIKPYENNPRINKNAVEKVKQSILQFGFNVPLTVDKDGVIATGHTRYQAAKELGLKKVLVIYLNDLTEEQIQAWRLVDNRTNEYAEWDFDKLNVELRALDSKGFDLKDFDFSLEDEVDLESDVGELKEHHSKEREIECPFCGEKIFL
jgi:ParB-like chromosome segregation protein Spo0J